MGDIHESFNGTRVFHASITADKWYRVSQFFEKDHRSIRPDYKLCTDILKMCICEFGIIFSNDILCIQYASFSEWFIQALNLKIYLFCKYSQLPVFGLKPVTCQSTVHCTEILCITFYVMKPRLLFHFYSSFVFLALKFMKTSSIVEKSLNKSFQTSYTFLRGPKYQTSNDVVYPQFKSRNKHSRTLSLKYREFLLSCIQWKDATLALRFVSY